MPKVGIPPKKPPSASLRRCAPNTIAASTTSSATAAPQSPSVVRPADRANGKPPHHVPCDHSAGNDRRTPNEVSTAPLEQYSAATHSSVSDRGKSSLKPPVANAESPSSLPALPAKEATPSAVEKEETETALPRRWSAIAAGEEEEYRPDLPPLPRWSRTVPHTP